MADATTTGSVPPATPAPEVYELYVGYLPVPPGVRRFLRWAVPAVLWVSCIACAAWAMSQRDPGPAIWEDSAPKSIEGTLLATPYPMVLTEPTASSAAPGEHAVILLVEMGKHGGAKRATEFDGKRVKVTGYQLHRDGRQMFELDPSPEAIAPVPGSNATPDEPRSMGPVTLSGEIMDSKCFLGAMKPGEGKTHKACATLCIRGGIPPMLVTRDNAGKPIFYLLTNPTGGPLSEDIFPLIGEPVDVTGQWFTWHGINLLRVASADVQRL
jgi:hypothetical protein